MKTTTMEQFRELAEKAATENKMEFYDDETFYVQVMQWSNESSETFKVCYYCLPDGASGIGYSPEVAIQNAMTSYNSGKTKLKF